jgi:hypothetical protein
MRRLTTTTAMRIRRCTEGGGRLSTWRKSRRAAELAKLRAELVRWLDRLDFRSDNLGQSLAAMARQVERTLRRLTA